MLCRECDLYDAENSYDGLCVYCYAEYVGHMVYTCFNCNDKSLNEDYYYLIEDHFYCEGCYQLTIEEYSDTEPDDDEDYDENNIIPNYDRDDIIDKNKESVPSA